MVETFDKFINPAAVDKAEQKFAHATPAAFFAAAKAGDTDAINLLFYNGKSVIAKAFWKYYLGPNRAMHRQRIRDKEDWDYAGEVYSMLLGQGLSANPLDKFNPATFKGQTLAFVINKFNYYLMRYCQNLAWVMIRQKNLEGLSGNIPKGVKPQFISKDIETKEGGPAMEGNLADLGTTEAAYETTEQSMEVKQFLNYIKNKRPDLYQVAVLGANGYSPKDIEQKLGLSAYHVKNKQAALKGEYMKNFAESVEKVKENLDEQPFDVEEGQNPLELYEGTMGPNDLWDILTEMMSDGSGSDTGLAVLGDVVDAIASGDADPYEVLVASSNNQLKELYADSDTFIEEDNVDKNALIQGVLRYLVALSREIKRL